LICIAGLSLQIQRLRIKERLATFDLRPVHQPWLRTGRCTC